MFPYNEIQVQHYCDNEQTVYGFQVAGGGVARCSHLAGEEQLTHRCMDAVSRLEQEQGPNQESYVQE